MDPNSRKNHLKRTLLILVGIPAVLYFLWSTSHFVIAYQEIKHAHVFPKNVEASGWQEPSNALSRDLPALAPFGSFTKDNSAYIHLAATTSTESVQEVHLPVTPPPPPPAPAPTTTAPTPPAATPTTTPALPLPVIVPPSVPLVPSSTPATSTSETAATSTPSPNPAPTPVSSPATTTEATTTIENLPPPNIVEILEAAMPSTTVATSTATSTSESTTTTSMLGRALPLAMQGFKNAGQFLLSQLVETAFATTTGVSTPAISTTSPQATSTASTSTDDIEIESTSSPIIVGGEGTTTPPAVPDVSSCAALGTQCHTMEFSGFGVSGSLTDKEFHGAQLNFSFANMSQESALQEGRLEVRYYHAGKWQTAGEIFLNKEISNNTNGGYFSAKLEGIDSWNDLSDLDVVVEYVRGDEHIETQVYLDSLWVDTSYKDRVQDVISGNTNDITDAPENVSFDTPQDAVSDKSLVTEDGAHIDFPYVDTLTDDSLVVRMDRQLYKVAKDKSPNTVFASVTNTTQTAQKFKTYVSFPGGKGEVLKLARYLRDVPVSTSTPIYHDVTYFCADGWQAASSTGGYSCTSTTETYQCDSVTDTKANCLVKNVHVDDATSTSYVSTWVDAAHNGVVDQDAQVTAALPPGYSVAASSQDEFDILPGQTIYLQLQVQTPDSTTRKFVLSVKGDSVFGDADSVRLKDEESWRAQQKFAAAQPERSHVNDQVSGKNDFAVDELPSFRFKFKTQRSFFQRVLDFLTRNQITFRVDKAVLIRAGDGEEEHVPVDIGYDPNGEWEMQLEKPPRSFRPGKYTVEMTMNEGGVAYTDSVDFYWGVLAVNTSKTVYNIGENAHLMMAALDDNGDTLCDAQLDLTITDPSGAKEDVPVISGGGCGFNNVTDLPDYVADYEPSISGEYTIELSRLNSDGAIVNSTSDTFEVQVDPAISIERVGPTRIYPVSPYKMRYNISAKENFKGTVTEVLPEGFLVPGLGGGTLERKNGALYLTWNLDLAAGASTSISYTFKAPDASPFLYILGPATFTEEPSGNKVFEETRPWKIASDALSIAAGTAWLGGTTTADGTEWDDSNTAAIEWTTDDFDDAYYTHSTSTVSGDPAKLCVQQAGDYYVALTVPLIRTDSNNTVVSTEADIRVNGLKVNQGVGRSGSTNRSTQSESANHLSILLHNLSANDCISADSHAITTVTGALNLVADNQASMYVEYIPSSESVFQAVATTTTFGPNLNGTATSAMMWYDVGSRVDSNYTHVNGPATSSSQIILAAQADYMVDINIPDDNSSAPLANMRPKGRVLLNGVMINGGEFKQGYIANSNAHTAASYHWSGVVHATTTNSVLTVTTKQSELSTAGTATVNTDQASIYIQKLPSSDIYFGRAVTTSGGTNWNPAATTSILWQNDDLLDAAYFSHSTAVNPQTITVQKAGDYLLAYNDALIGSTARLAPRVSVIVSSTMQNGAFASEHFIRDAAGTDVESSGMLVYFLRNLSAGDTISLQTIADTVNGTMTATQNALLMLWHKAAQSNWIQDTEAWYQNTNALTPTTRWPGTSDGDAIGSGNAVSNGDALRLRMTLQAQVAAATSSDNFKLQYAAGDTCSAALSWSDVGATGSGTIWRFHDNASVIDGATTTTLLISTASTSESYNESNPTVFLQNPVAAKTDGEWDWSIEDNSAPAGINYCFRMVQSSGAALKNYNDYPSLITNNSPNTPTPATPFDNEKFASTSPWFTFSTTDDNGDDVDYQIQISTGSTFASTVIDTNSVSNTNDFDNVQTPSDRQPFNSSETIRYKVPSGTPLTNGTTYYWRVRSIDTGGTNSYGSWSSTQSFTVDTSVNVSTWFQTQTAQFTEGTLSSVESTSTNDVGMSAGQTTGSIVSPAITYEEHTSGNSWGTLSKSDSYTAPNTIKYQIEYLDATSTWTLVPDSDLTGNSSGTTTSSLNISSLDPTTYDSIRVRANFTRSTATPRLNDWTVSWALSVARPSQSKLFDNEKTSTTTPTFQFTTTDPQGDRLSYQMQWSTDPTFATGISSSVSDSATTTFGWSDVTAPGSASPFVSGHSVQFTISTTTPLTNGTTYWWRVRAKDTLSSNAYSLWSTSRSFTVDTAVDRSTWFQTTNAQFNTDTLVRTQGTNNTAAVSIDTGKIAIYRANTAGEAQTTTVLNQKFDTTVRQDDLYAMQYASSSILLTTGHYAVMYGFREDTTGGTGRSITQANLSLASTSLAIGWSSGMMVRSAGSLQSGGGVIDVTSDNTPLVLQSFRTDTNTGTQIRSNGRAGIQILRLDDNWHYLRLSKSGKQTGPTSATWKQVTYNSEDETDTTTFGHSAGDSTIVLKSTGHYLVFANTYGVNTATASNVLNQKFVLNGSDVRGSYSTLFIGTTNVAEEGALSMGMIINVTVPNSTFSVQVNRTVGTSAFTINANTAGAYVNRTGITMVKIPEGDFIRMSTTTAQFPAMAPTATTTVFWGTEDEKDTASFLHSANSDSIQTQIAGDYLAFSTLYSSSTPLSTANTYMQGWQRSGSTGFQPYGLTGGYENTTTAGNNVGNWAGIIFSGMSSGNTFQVVTQGISTNKNGIFAANNEVEALRIASLSEADNNLQTVDSSDINFTDGSGPRWDAITWNDSTPGTSDILYQVLYYHSASSSYDLVPDSALTPKNVSLTNSVGTSSGPIDISGLDKTTYGILRLRATLTCAAGNCPTLNDWTTSWNPGVSVSGTAKLSDETTNLTSGNVAIAVNGVIQGGKNATINGSGQWTLSGINAGVGDVITVWISSATGVHRAVAVTKPTSINNVAGMVLYENHLTLGSYDGPTISNADIGQWDDANSSAVIDDVDASNNLTVCPSGSDCFNAKLMVGTSTVYQPSNGTSVTVNTRNFENDGTTIADGNTFNISGTYRNSYVFTKGTSQVNFTATSTTERIDSTGATSSAAFNNVTFGTSGSALWKLSTPLAASGTLAVNFGTLVQGATSTIFLSGDLSIGASGIWAKNSSTTFMGTATETWTDSSSGQDLGTVIVGGASTTVQLGSNVKATDLTIKPGNMLDASTGNWNLNIIGNWVNNYIFNARQGTVTFLATSTGKTVTPGISSFYNMTFNGGNGNWSFTTPTTTALNNFTIATGTVTLPTGTTTVGGSWDSFSGSFQHNNSTVLFNATASGKTIHVATSTAFYDMTFSGSGGGWSFVDQNATSSRTVLIQAGTVTMPGGVLAIGGTLTNSGGAISANSGTLKFTGANASSVTLGTSNAFNLTFSGIGPFTMLDTNATSSGSVRFEQGTTTLPSGSLGVGASFVNAASPAGGFVNNNGIVRFVGSTAGNSITPGTSKFYQLIFNGAGGNWTITANATSTSDTTFTAAGSITQTSGTTLEVDGMFTNALANAATTWTGSNLYLNSGTNYAINAKANGGDTYAQLTLGANTQVSAWNSSATTIATNATGSFYSQNNAAVSGALNIYGAFSTSTPLSWAYQMDFDNTTLGVGRQVNVKIASSSVVTLSGSTTIMGIPSASTTIANQGSGRFFFNISGGTTTAQYFTVASTSPAGLNFSGTPIVSKFQDGDFTVNYSSSTAITVADTVIDANQAAQWQRMKFSTSTGVAFGFNVTLSTVPSSASFWWFRNAYGNAAGENYDADVGGNPGYIQWDDSGITASFTGRVYSDHGVTAMGSPTCDGVTQNVTLVVSSGAAYTTSCNGSGVYTFPSVIFNTSAVLTVYLNSSHGNTKRAATITKSATGNVSGLDLYQNAVILRQEDVTPDTISDLAFKDSAFDSDIPFTVSGGNLTVQPEMELYVWPNKFFAPGGNITLQSGGSGDARDGRMYLATSSTFTAAGTQSFSIGGGLQLDSGATFSAANSVITFAATTTGKSIYSTKPLALYDVVFNGVGGGWNFIGTSTATTSMHTLTPTAGTIGGGGDVDVQSGNITGAGTIAMTGGTFLYEPTGNFGNNNAWTFSNLTFGTSTLNTTTKMGTGTTTVTSVLRIASNQTLLAGTSTTAAWVLSGAGTPFVINGTFNAQIAPFWYTANSATNITSASYGPLFLEPSGAGSPTYTLGAQPFVLGMTTIGDGTHTVTVSGTLNDPTIDFTRDLTINANATFIAPDLASLDMNIEGSWTNSGTFTPSGNRVIFDATSTGRTINPGSSPFAKLQFNSSSGGWTITGNATSTSDTTLGAAQSFTLASGKSLEVDGTFTNSVASSSQTWTGSLLYLNSGTSYSINTKSSGNATYGTISIGTNTNIRDWNSAQSSAITASTASLYAQNYASSTGALNIYGAYNRTSGSDYWDYATDFDGTSLGATSRKVNVSIAANSTLTFSGGLLDIIGSANASTTIQNQGSGAYAWNVSGGTINAQYFEVRNTDANGLNLSGYPVISGLSNGDFLLSTNGGSSITVNGTVIVSNPLKVFRFDKFATSSGISSGFNVTPVAATSSFWKFNLHYGNYAGEAFDNDPDPGFIHWDDSNDKISVIGTVYTDDGVTHETSPLCDGVTPVIKMKVEGAGSAQTSCASGTGLYSFASVAYNPGDVLTVYIASSSKRSATITRGETANINNMDIYEHRVIVRHEDTTPISIADIDQFDSGQDTMVPFLATQAATNTLIVEPNTKLVVWTGKTFAPAGNVTVSSGGVNSWDGTIELQANSIFSASGAQTHTFGGSYILNSGAIFVRANSTVVFNATTTGKTITPQNSAFYNVTFNGSGGNWAFSAAATSTNDFTITTGTVTLPTSVLEVGGSFTNSGGVFQHNNGTVKLTSTVTGKTIQVNNSPFYNLIANGSGGGWSFIDSSATSSNDLTIAAGTFKAPATTLTVGGSFLNSGTFQSNNGTVKMIAAVGGKSVQAGGSDFYNLLFSGAGGGWTFLDLNATTSRDFIMSTGTVRMASGTIAVGGNFNSASTTFINNSGIVKFTATTTGFNINVGTSTFYQLVFDSSAGGWTIGSNATSTATTTINNAASLTLASGKSLEVDGVFNNLAGSATTWTGSTLYLNSGGAYSINSRTNTGATYGQLTLGTNTQVRDWGSNAATTTIGSSAYLYSQNDSGTIGKLVIYGTYVNTNSTDYWSANRDFDGTDISASPRQVNVRIATSSSVSYAGGSLGIVGTSTATTTIYASGTGNYSFSIAGGSTTMQYYQFKNMDSNGMQLSGAPVINGLSNGDFEMSVASGTIMTVANTVINANANLTFSTDRFATTSANTRGFNVMYTGSTAGSNFWLFTGAYGNLAGEANDADGSNACGHILWDDSICLQISESHYRFRNDDGGEGAATSTWYNSSWSAREKIVINNPNATSYTNIPVKILLPYKSSMKSTFDDIRFTDSSGTTTISYWRESTISSGTSTVWVKIASLPASGSATVYVYYGNSGASGADDSANTFPYIDTFDDGDITDYSQGGTDRSLFAANSSFSYGNGSFGLSASAGNTSGKTTNGGIFKTAGTPTAQGKTIRYFQYVANGGQDEPCTLFGVQAAKQNYGVCLEQFPTTNRRVSLAKNIAFNDNGDTASVMASTSVTYSTTGWYEVIIDWLTGGTISVHVNDPNGNAFASLSTSSATYSSGGMGFAFFFQSQGWDDYMVKPYTASTPTYQIAPEQLNNGASWKAAEDTKANITEGQNTRLRFNVQNTGSAFTFGFRLQYAPKGASLSCEAVDPLNYNDVPAFNSCGSNDICMASSTQVTTLASTSPSLSYPASFGFTAGEIVQDPYNQSIQYFIPKNYATELEYTFKVTSHAQQPAYCFRVWNTQTSADLDVYNHVAEGDVLYPPFISNFQLNNSQNISLIEGTTTTVYASSTVTDYNGYADIASATSSIYLSTLSPNCASDPIDCYQVSTSSCSLSNCSGNSCSLMCRADIFYFAEPTDATSSNYATTSTNWLASLAVSDTSGLKDTETSIGQDLNSLAGLSVNEGNIAFATSTANSDTGRTVATTTVRNVGNIPISVDLTGANLTDGGSNFIAVTNEKVSSSTFQYATCSLCQNLQGATAVNVNVNISRPTTTTASLQTQTDLYWGIQIPNGTYATTYTGSNTFTAVPP